MTPSFIAWAGRQLRPFQAHIERHQSRQRFARMLRIDPQLRAAHERLQRDRKRHDKTAADLKAMQDRLHAMLRGSVGA